MIVAVPYLQGEVNAHFGSTQAFLIAETSDDKVERTSIFEVQGMQHNHAGIAGFLKEQGVQTILAGGMGAPMQQALKLQGFELYCGISGAAVEAVEALLEESCSTQRPPADIITGSMVTRSISKTTKRTDGMNSRQPKPLQWVRYSVQALIAAYVLLVVIANTVGQSFRAANLHTICPFGGVVNLYTYFSDGGYVAKLHSAVFIMLLALLIGLVLTGKSFCGWNLPLGSVQQGLGWIGQRLWPRAYNKLPRWLERVLQYLKWAVLAWVLVQTARSATLVFQDYDPYYNLYRIWTDNRAERLHSHRSNGDLVALHPPALQPAHAPGGLQWHLQLRLVHRAQARRQDLYRLRPLLKGLPG